MKRILLLSLLLLPIVALAQYPTFSNKQKLGVQTTGDGLIFRGNSNPNYNPSNINNAYFHLDTTLSKLYLYSVGTWQLVYPTPQFDTTTLNVYLKISDTTAMLLPYFRDSDTTSLNLINRFALKLNISDTATMLTPYMKKADTISLSNRINLKLNISDTTILSNRITTNANNIITINNKLATKLDTIYTKFKNVVKMIVNKDTINIGSSLTDGYAINIIGDSVNVDTTLLDIRYPDRDSTNELQDITFATTSGVITISGSKVMNLDTLYNSVIDSVNLLIRDSIAAFTPLTEGFGINIIGDSINIDTTIIFTQSDTITLSNRIDTKLNVSDTVSLSNRIDLKLNKTDTINLSNRIDLKLNKSDTISLSNRIDIKLNASDTVSLSNRINKKLDTLYVNYQTSIDTIVNKDTINITTLEAGAGINITNNVISLDTTLLDSVVRVQNVYVKNGTGTVLNKGEAVYVTGANGTNIIVGRASNVAESSSSKTLGLTMTSIAINGFGYVVKEGLLAGLNTNSATAGDPIWLGVNGALIYGLANKPYAPNHLVYLGVVTRKQQNNGEVYVTVQNGFEIKELHDVQIINPVNKASLYYNLSESLWRDTTPTLLVSDTASMLNPYLRKLDTISLSNRIDLRVKYADTTNMLLPYFRTNDTTLLNLNSRLSIKLNLSDTASMLSKYVNTYSNQTGINGNKTFNNTVSVDSLNSTKQAKIQSLTVGRGGIAIIGGTSGGISSTAFGYEALKNNTSGDWNTAIGYQTLLNNDTAWNNVAIGNNSLNFNTGGEYNTAVGVESLFSNKVGNNNVAIGYYAGTNNKGSNNIYIGNQTYHTDSVNNVLMIGGVNTPLLSGIITGNKKLGINKNPLTLTHTFEVNSPISDAVKINSNTNSTNLELMNSNGTVSIKSSNKNMILQTDSTALVYLNGENNKVGILTMNPEQALEVAGTIRVDSLDNNLTPDKLVGGSNSNDLTNVELGTGLSFVNDTLKIDDNIINSGDTATLLRQDFIPLTSNQVIWTQGNKKLLKYFTQVYRNGQLLKDVQYTISSDSIVTIEEGSYKLGDIITVIAIDNIVALAGSGSTITLQGDVTGNGTNNITTYIGVGKVTNTMLAGSISDNKLNTITTAGKVSNSATTATDVNTANHIVSRDASGNFSAGTITASLNGNANTSTTLATGRTIGITGDLTYTSPSFNGSANVTAVGTLVNSGVTANTYTAATVTVDAKGRITSASNNTIPTVNDGTLTMAVSGNGLTGSQTFTANQSSAATFTVTSNATSDNTANTIVYRDANKDFSVRNITASNITASNFYGLASTATISNGVQSLLTTGIIKLATPSNSVQPTITVPDVNATMARTDAAQTFTGTQTFSSTISGSITGNAATVTTNANLTGDVTSTGNNTSIATGVIVNADINASAAIAVSKLAASTISGITLGNNLNTLTISTPLTGTSYNGSSVVSIGLQAATTSVAGSMSAADKSKLDGIAAGAQVNVPTNLAQGTRTTTTVPITSSTGTTATLDIATTSLAGVMSSADKTKLDGIASGATANTGTVTSVSGTGTVSGLTLTGTVSSTGNLTLGGTLSLTSGNVTTALGYTPYNNTNPNGYITSSSLSSYLPLSGGTLTGGLTGTTGSFNTSFAIGYPVAYKPLEVFSNPNDYVSVGVNSLGQYQWSGIHFGYREPNTQYRKSAIVFQRNDTGLGGSDGSGKIHILNVNIGNTFKSADLSDAKLTISNNGFIGINDTTPSFNLDVNGTLGVSGTTTLSNLGSLGTGVVVTSNTGLLSTATTVGQTGIMTTGNWTTSTGASVATFDVTHNLGVEPSSVIITPQTINGGATKIFYEVIGKTSSIFRVQAFNLTTGSPATNTAVSIYWIAIK